jgi:hypothetical protein
MDACLTELVDRREITQEVAVSRMKNPAEFHLLGHPNVGRKTFGS